MPSRYRDGHLIGQSTRSKVTTTATQHSTMEDMLVDQDHLQEEEERENRHKNLEKLFKRVAADKRADKQQRKKQHVLTSAEEHKNYEDMLNEFREQVQADPRYDESYPDNPQKARDKVVEEYRLPIRPAALKLKEDISAHHKAQQFKGQLDAAQQVNNVAQKGRK
jgi:hypothetical protein